MWLMDTYHKAKAGTILQNLFDFYNDASFTKKVDAYALSQNVIVSAWDKNTTLYDGTFGKRPHELAFASSALASCLVEYNASSAEHHAILIALTNILNEVSVNGALYCFNDLDKELIANAISQLQEFAEREML